MTDRQGSVARLAVVTYLSAVLGVVTGPLLARALGPVGRGEVASAVVYFAIATAVAGLGIPIAIGQAGASGKYPSAALLGTSLRFVALLVIPSLLAAAAVVAGPLSGLSRSGRVGTAVLMSLVPLGVLVNVLLYLLMAEGALRPMTTVQGLPLVLTAVATVALFVSGTLTVGSYLLVVIVAALLSLFAGWKLLGLAPRGRVPLVRLLSFGIRGYGWNLAVFVSVRLDQAFVGPILGSRELGFYAISAAIASLPFSVALALSSRSFSRVAGSTEDDRAVVISRFLRLTFVIALGCAAVLALTSPVLLPLLYGRDFVSALPPLFVLLPGAVALSVSASAASSLIAVGRPGKATIAELTGLLITVIGLPLLTPSYGIVGAAVVSSVAYTATMFAYLMFLRPMASVSLRTRKEDFFFLAGAVRDVASRVPVRRRSIRRVDGS